MPPETKPETPTEGGRVYKELTVDQLKTYAADAPSGYQVANKFRKLVENNLTAQARSNLAAGHVHAVGFEVETDVNAGNAPPPFLGFQGAVGVSVVWLVGATGNTDVGPHVYVFAKQGVNGVEAIGDAPDASKQVEACFFAANFGGQPSDLTPGAWEEALGTVGVDATGGGGLLSGEVITYSTNDSAFVWDMRDVWYVFVTDLVVANAGTTVSASGSNYAFYVWLLGQLGIFGADEGSSWAVPVHPFWEAVDALVPDWGGASAASAGATGGENEVCFPSGECLPIVDGPDDASDEHWLLGERYWDPQDSGTELLDTSGDHWGTKLSEDILVADLAQSGAKEFDKARIAPELVRFLQAYLDELNERSDEGVMLDVTSGYRSWWHNRHTDEWPADLPAADVQRVETQDGGYDVDVDGDGDTEHFEWKITLKDGSGPIYGEDVTKSEHCAGRGVDLHVESTTCTVTSSAAYLRDDEDHEAITGELPDDSPLEGRSDVRKDDGNWELVDGTSVTVTDRDVGPSGQIVVEVEVDGTVVGWTNRANLDCPRNPGFDAWDLGRIALATPDERDVEGVSACDTRLGIEHDGNQFVHVDVKPRGSGDWFPYWFYTGEPDDYTGETETQCDRFRKKRVIVDLNNDCAELPKHPRVMRVFYDASRVYVVDNTAAYLRDPDDGYNPYTEDDPPDDRNWNSIDEVVRHDDDEHWKVVDGTEVELTAEATGPSGQTVVKAETNESNPTVLGWTNLANLAFE